MTLFKTAIGAALLFFFVLPGLAKGEPSRWLLVDTSAQSLMVMEGQTIKQRFDNISVGRNGTAPLRYRGDNTTPLGTFRIAWVNPNSRYKTFFGFDYPNLPLAEQALRRGLIDLAAYNEISSAIRHGQLPPQNTPLGGYLGIHGLGRADPKIHATMNWTQGCIALTNQQIDELSQWIEVGTRVVISEGNVAALQTAANTLN